MRSKAIVRIPSERTVLAYMAGIVDGEGCIFIRTCKGPTGTSQSYTVELNVTNTDEHLIAWLIELFGGLWREKAKEKGARRRSYVWWVSGNNTGRILDALLPYLMVKRAQAVLALQFLVYRHGKFHGRRYDPVFVRECATMKTQMQLLKLPTPHAAIGGSR